jgi:hypothetical protein
MEKYKETIVKLLKDNGGNWTREVVENKKFVGRKKIKPCIIGEWFFNGISRAKKTLNDMSWKTKKVLITSNSLSYKTVLWE